MPELTSGAGALLMAAILGYLFGSIPFGVIVTRLLGLGERCDQARSGLHRRSRGPPWRDSASCCSWASFFSRHVGQLLA